MYFIYLLSKYHVDQSVLTVYSPVMKRTRCIAPASTNMLSRQFIFLPIKCVRRKSALMSRSTCVSRSRLSQFRHVLPVLLRLHLSPVLTWMSCTAGR